MNSDKTPLLVGHRGYMHRYPENTWRSLQAALQAGACWVEFDIQLCADGKFILLHDGNFERTSGINTSPFELASDELALSVHEPGKFGNRYASTPVATLTDILEELSKHPYARAMVELKQESIDHWGLEHVMENLLPVLHRFPAQVCLISFNLEALQWCRANSTLQIGWVLYNYDTDARKLAEQLQPEYLICNHRKIPENTSLWSSDSDWMLYDIMDAESALDWARRGAALIETADIGTLLQHPLLGKRACRHAP